MFGSRVPQCVVVVASALLLQGSLYAQPCVAPPADLDHWWPLDGCNTLHDVAGDLPAIKVGNPLLTSGYVGQSLRFDGIDDELVMPVPPYDPSEVSIEAWILPDQVNDYGAIVEGGVGHDYRFLLYVYSGELNYEYRTPTGSGFDNSVRANLQSGVWTHVAVTQSFGLEEIRFYVNGSLNAVHQALDGRFISPIVEMRIGHGFSGKIDEPSVYSRRLGPAEIQSIFLADRDGKCHAEECEDFGIPGWSLCDPRNELCITVTPE